MNHQNKFDIKRNLIVNYLPASFSQDDIKALFSRIGIVTNCKLMKNKESGQSLGYAFIEYPTEELAANAIAQVDGLKIEDKVVKVSYARQSSPDIKDSNVYIAGLPIWVTEDKLFSLFSPFGNIITHKLLVDNDHTSRGVGFVRYALKSEAQNAIDAMCGKQLPDAASALVVKLAIPPASKQQNPASAVSGNRSSVRFNPIVPSNQMALTQQVSGVPMAGVIESLNGTRYIGGSPTTNGLNGMVQARQNLGGQVHSLYVYGLQPTHTELTLYELFAPFGAILNVKLIRDLTKEEKPCKGFGFVNFRKYEEAYSAFATMNACPFEGKNLQVSFKNNNNRQSTGAEPLAVAIQQIHQGPYTTFATTPAPYSSATTPYSAAAPYG